MLSFIGLRSVVVEHQTAQLGSDLHLLQVVRVRNQTQRVWAVLGAFQSVDPETLFAHDAPNFVVLALEEFHVQPRVCILLVRNFDDVRSVLPAGHLAAGADIVQFLVVESAAEDSDLIGALDLVGRHFKRSRQLTIVRDKQQSF